MNPNTDFAAMLEQSLAVLQNRGASAADCSAAAEQARMAVHGIDTENESAPAREAKVLAALSPPINHPFVSGGAMITETLAALTAAEEDNRQRALLRKAVQSIAEQLERRARERGEFEAGRDAVRKPFAAQSRRATELAEKILAIYLPNAAKVVTLFYDDVLVSRLGESAYSNLPAPRGTHINYVRTWRVQRLLTTPEVMSATKLPEHWPPRFNDYSVLEQRRHFEEDDDDISRPNFA
jgi:hypothetical protein